MELLIQPIVGLCIMHQLHLHFNLLEQDMMFGSEIKEDQSIVWGTHL